MVNFNSKIVGWIVFSCGVLFMPRFLSALSNCSSFATSCLTTAIDCHYSAKYQPSAPADSFLPVSDARARRDRSYEKGRGRDEDFSPPTGSPEAVAHLRFPQNVACGFPAPRSSALDSQLHSEGLQRPVGKLQFWSL